MQNWLKRLGGLRHYPALVAGLIIIAIFIGTSVYAVVDIPYSEAVRLWRGGEGVWDDSPRNAAPVWFDVFTSKRLPRTIIVTGTSNGTGIQQETASGLEPVDITLTFQYPYDGFPDELRLFLEATYEGSPPSVTLSWRTPDGRTIVLQENRLIRKSNTYFISQDRDLYTQLSVQPEIGLFADPADQTKSLQGDYTLELTGEFPAASELNAKLVVYGKISGLAGTDNRRRDLMVALLWGAPIALVFGIAAAVGTTLVTFALSATGTWMGGKVDRTFQWVTQVNLIIPLLPVLIMVGYLYDRSIWTMLGLVIALNIFGSTMLTYRAMFLQAKEAPYIEAAQAYGAGNRRIIFRYLMPRIAPTLLPEFVLVIPTFVFLEATLAVLGLGDPVLPTWGKVLDSAFANSALLKGYYYWFLEPAILLMSLGIGFSLIGYSLDRIFNPRLRTM
jgi:peptide/nickel transport system permease protein